MSDEVKSVNGESPFYDKNDPLTYDMMVASEDSNKRLSKRKKKMFADMYLLDMYPMDNVQGGY